MTKIIIDKEEKEDMGEDLEKKAFEELVSNMENKDTKDTSVHNIKEGQIEDLKVMYDLHMLIKKLNLIILNMVREERLLLLGETC